MNPIVATKAIRFSSDPETPTTYVRRVIPAEPVSNIYEASKLIDVGKNACLIDDKGQTLFIRTKETVGHTKVVQIQEIEKFEFVCYMTPVYPFEHPDCLLESRYYDYVIFRNY
jgi:hypothetical protein